MNLMETVGPHNHEILIADVLDRFDGKVFNLLVTSQKSGGTEKVLRYCNRTLGGVVIARPLQVSIRLSPGGCIAWDLVAEQVSIAFEDKNVVICRFFDNRQYRKVLLLTSDPI